MEEVLTNLTVFCNIKLETIRNLMEILVFSSVLTIISRQIIAWSISHSLNHIKKNNCFDSI